MWEDCCQQKEHIGNDYVADPMLDARHMSKPDKVIVLQDFTLLWVSEQNHEVLGVKSSMKKRKKYKERESDRRKFYYFYFTDENTEKLKNTYIVEELILLITMPFSSPFPSPQLIL